MTKHHERTDPEEERRFEEWARKTALVREWEAMKQDVLRHKWFESEKAGHDIGWDRAFVDYNIKIRRKQHQHRDHKSNG